MKERIFQSFNKSANTYDSAAVLQTQVAKRLAQRLPQFSAQKILEIGCGTGVFSKELLEMYPQAFFLLTDLSPEMIKVCQRRFADLAHVSMEPMDGEHFTTRTNFDLIVSSMTLHWFLDIKTSFEKIIQCLPKNGKFIFAMLGKKSLTEWHIICKENHFPIFGFPSAKLLQQHFPNIKIAEVIVLPTPVSVPVTKNFFNISYTHHK